MHFRIADTFTHSLGRRTSDEQKASKTTAFDWQVNPTNPRLSFHKLERCKDTNFRSVRVNRDIRMIFHKTDASLLFCYVDDHDEAYSRAERAPVGERSGRGAPSEAISEYTMVAQ